MKIILLQNIKLLGQKGEIKNVADGYAQNFLFPQKLAQPASQEKIQSIQNKKNKEIKIHKQEAKELNKLINKISNQKIIISKPASEKGKLFSAVSTEDILFAIYIQLQVDLKKFKVKVNEHVKEIGEHQINLKIKNQQVKIILNIKNE